MGVWAGTHVEFPPRGDGARPSRSPGPHPRRVTDLPVSASPYDHRRVSVRRSSPRRTGARRPRRCAVRSRGRRRRSPLTPVTVVVPGNSVGVAQCGACSRRVISARSRPQVSASSASTSSPRYRLAELLAAPQPGRRSGPAGRCRHAGGLAPRCAACSPIAPGAGCSRRWPTHPATEEALVRAVPRALRPRRCGAEPPRRRRAPRARSVRIHRAGETTSRARRGTTSTT